jgi:hypothetical protein
VWSLVFYLDFLTVHSVVPKHKGPHCEQLRNLNKTQGTTLSEQLRYLNKTQGTTLSEQLRNLNKTQGTTDCTGSCK